LTDAEIVPDGRHGLQDMRIIRAIHEAAETGDVIEL
jgi:xylose dehydrogenase (NAD/NADP)